MAAEQSPERLLQLVPELRRLTGSTISNEALLTYLLKSNGDLAAAADNSNCGEQAVSQVPQESSAEAPQSTPVTKGSLGDTQTRVPDSTSALTKGVELSQKAPTSFASQSIDSDNLLLGRFEADVTSSCRTKDGAFLLGQTNLLNIQFRGVRPTSRNRQKAAGALGPQVTNISQIICRLRTAAEGHVSIGGRYLGRLQIPVSSMLGPLVYCDFIRITAELEVSSPMELDIGTSVPISVCVYLTQTALKHSISQLLPQAEAGLRDSWVALLFTHLKLQPKRPSVFWSRADETTELSETTPQHGAVLFANTETPDTAESHRKRRRLNDQPDPPSSPAGESAVEDDFTLGPNELASAMEKTDEVLGIASPTTVKAEVVALSLHPAVFRSHLRDYQTEGVQWMLSQEDRRRTRQTDGERVLHPMWDEFEIEHLAKGSFVFYFNRTTGAISEEFPEARAACLGGLLSDEMGLGKTVQTIALIATELAPSPKEEKEYSAWLNAMNSLGSKGASTPLSFQNYLVQQRRREGSAIRRHVELAAQQEPPNTTSPRLWGGTLIVLPLSLIPQWRCELETHLYPGVCVIMEYYGPDRCRDPLTLSTADIVLTTYGTLASELVCGTAAACDSDVPTPALRAPPVALLHWRRIVLDEAHMIKSHITKSCRAVCSLAATTRWCLTGTPIQNSIEDLYAYLKFLHVEPWGNWVWWNKLVVEPLQKRSKDLHSVISAVRSIIQPILLRRTKATLDKSGNPIAALPPKTEHLLILQLSEAERQFYDAVFRKASTEFDELIQSGQVLRNYTHVLELLLRLRQAACYPLLVYSGSSTRVLQSFGTASEWVARFLRGSGNIKGGELSEAFLKKQLQELPEGNVQSECPICFEPPEDPIITPCGHIMCRSCTLAAFRSSAAQPLRPADKSKSQLGYPCPICRVVFTKASIAAVPGATHLAKRVIDCLLDDAGNFRYSAKLRALADHLEVDIKENRRAVVFSQWTVLLDIIEVMLKCLNITNRRFDGSLTLQQRQKVISWFEARPSVEHNEGTSVPTPVGGGAVLLVSLRAGGVGLNLTSATRCYLMDPWWNPAVEDQAIQRIHRIGQTQEVIVYRLICERTVEERILELQKTKQLHATGVLDSTGSAETLEASKLTVEDLQIMFRKFV